VDAFLDMLLNFMNQKGQPDLSFEDIDLSEQTVLSLDRENSKRSLEVPVRKLLKLSLVERILTQVTALELQLSFIMSSRVIAKSQQTYRSVGLLTNNESEFIRRLSRKLPFFETIDGIEVKGGNFAERSRAETSSMQRVSSVTAEKDEAGPGELNVGVIAGAAVAILLIGLGGGGFVYFKRRSSSNKRINAASDPTQLNSESTHDVEFLFSNVSSSDDSDESSVSILPTGRKVRKKRAGVSRSITNNRRIKTQRLGKLSSSAITTKTEREFVVKQSRRLSVDGFNSRQLSRSNAQRHLNVPPAPSSSDESSSDESSSDDSSSDESSSDDSSSDESSSDESSSDES